MTPRRLAACTRAFVSAVVQAVEELPRGRTADVIGLQLLRSGTSVGANYRAACRARSRKEFIAKMGIVEEEADESEFWLGLLLERGLLDAQRASLLRRDAGQILAMTVSSIRTARQGRRRLLVPPRKVRPQGRPRRRGWGNGRQRVRARRLEPRDAPRLPLPHPVEGGARAARQGQEHDRQVRGRSLPPGSARHRGARRRDGGGDR